MSRSDKNKIGWIIVAVLALALINGVVFHLFPGKFSIFAYIFFLFIPLMVAVAVIFTKFSLLFIKDAEEGKKESLLLQERQKEIVENMVEGLVVHDSKGKILVVNAAAENFLGMNGSELVGRTADKISKHSGILAVLFNDLKEGEVFEHSFSDEKGLELSYQIIKVNLNKKRGEVLKIIREVTRFKYLDKMKNEYITIMSHKFLTPLTNIKWSADFLLNSSEDEERKKGNIKNILDNTDKLVKLTSYLLDITEIEEGLFGYNFEKLDMDNIVENAIQGVVDISEQKKIKIIYHKPKNGNYFVSGDKVRLGVAVSNYLDNALKYTPENGKIEILLEENGNDLRLSVSDTGIGVSQESARLLFSKFFRDKWAKSLHTEGSGLGLFIIKNIIEHHGGNAGYLGMGVDGKGSTFYLSLPLYKNKV